MEEKIKAWKSKSFSWSQISSWEYSPEQWFSRYILKEKQEESSAMAFGKLIGEKLALDASFMPQVPRLPVYEYKLESRLGDIPLVGYIDAFDISKPAFIEFKTGKKWNKVKAESHGQIDLYCAMLYTMHKIKPEDLDIRLIWLATEETGDFQTQFIKDMKPVIFPLKKTMLDVVNMLIRVKRVRGEMIEYIKSYPHNII